MKNNKFFKNTFYFGLTVFENQIKENKFNQNNKIISLVYPKWNKTIFFQMRNENLTKIGDNKFGVNIIPTLKYYSTIFVNNEKQFNGLMFGYDLIEHILGAETSEYEQTFGATYEQINKTEK